MRRRRFFVTFVELCVFLAVFSVMAHAEVPQLINYQGYIADTSGTPLEGTYSVTFSIYDAEEGGSILWTETQDVGINNGVFNVLLGSVVSFTDDLFASEPRYLGIRVGSDPEMDPRLQITSTPYSMNSQRLGGKTLAEVSPSGMISIFMHSCPEGWSRVSAFDGRFLRGAMSYGNIGGTESHDHDILPHNHTIPSHYHSVPSHSHALYGDVDCTGGDSWCSDKWYVKQSPSGSTSLNTNSVSLTTNDRNALSDSAEHLPPYIDVIFCRKD